MRLIFFFVSKNRKKPWRRAHHIRKTKVPRISVKGGGGGIERGNGVFCGIRTPPLKRSVDSFSMRRKAKEKMVVSVSESSSSSGSDVSGDQSNEDHSTKEEDIEIRCSGQSSKAFFVDFPRRVRSKRGVNNNNNKTTTAIIKQQRPKRRLNKKSSDSKQHRKLDSNVFEGYLENLWKSLSEEKRTHFSYLDCLWFDLYRKRAFKGKVLMWIKGKSIFSRKYVFIPIVCWRHWSLLILCHFGENLESETTKPCMLLLDSLGMENPKRLEPDIKKFVQDIYREEGRPEKKEAIANIPLLVPKVPQQKNKDDCGFFVLYFIYLFVENAPENFNRLDGYPYFMNENWFDDERLETFRNKVRSSCSMMLLESPK